MSPGFGLERRPDEGKQRKRKIGKMTLLQHGFTVPKASLAPPATLRPTNSGGNLLEMQTCILLCKSQFDFSASVKALALRALESSRNVKVTWAL